ncbi:MAG: hypothetical protein AAGK32_16435, partial [Actinomycetota bacterium]
PRRGCRSAGETRTVVLRLSGPYLGDDRYRLDVAHQPTVNDDRARIRTRLTDGWRFTDPQGAELVDGELVFEGALTEDLLVEATITPD